MRIDGDGEEEEEEEANRPFLNPGEEEEEDLGWRTHYK